MLSKVNTGSFDGKVNKERKNLTLWQCAIIYHIKEETLKFNMQKSSSLLPLEKSCKNLELSHQVILTSEKNSETSKY